MGVLLAALGLFAGLFILIMVGTVVGDAIDEAKKWGEKQR